MGCLKYVILRAIAYQNEALKRGLNKAIHEHPTILLVPAGRRGERFSLLNYFAPFNLTLLNREKSLSDRQRPLRCLPVRRQLRRGFPPLRQSAWASGTRDAIVASGGVGGGGGGGLFDHRD